MSEFRESVRERLRRLDLDKPMQDEIAEEIATHLEFDALRIRREGVDEAEARQRVMSGVDWDRLRKGIQQNKETGMRDRFRRLWLPALMTGTIAYALQYTFARMLVWPRSLVIGGNHYSFAWQWYVALLLTGALGAYWSRKMGGSTLDRIAVALAPSVSMAVAIAVVLPIDLTISSIEGHGASYAVQHPTVFLAAVLMWVVVPAVPSLLGAATFLSQRVTPQVV